MTAAYAVFDVQAFTTTTSWAAECSRHARGTPTQDERRDWCDTHFEIGVAARLQHILEFRGIGHFAPAPHGSKRRENGSERIFGLGLQGGDQIRASALSDNNAFKRLLQHRSL